MEKNTIRGKSPLRLSFAGGGTDLDYIFNRYGGAVVSTTIDKYCHMNISPRKDNKIIINGQPIDSRELLAQRVVRHFKPRFGFDMSYYHDVLPGTGLGSSSSFTVLMLRMLYEIQNSRPNDYDLVEEAYKIETGIKEGGRQDQYATCFGGFNFMEFGEQVRVYPLRLKYSFMSDLQEHFVLVNINGVREEDIHQVQREYEERNIKEMERTARIKDLAYQMRDCLLNTDLRNIGDILHKNWQLKRNPFTTNRKIDSIYELARKNGAEGGKICGAGGCGHFLFFCRPNKRHNLVSALESKCKIVDFNFGVHGTETWRPNENRNS